MQSDWLWGLAGGGLIGLAASMYLLINGRIMGASGILGGVVDGSGRGTLAERLAFLGALVAVPGLYALAQPELSTNLTPLLTPVIAGGVLVGLGTRLAGGCTSGHGVCGISRLSRRGIAASVIYVGIGGVVMALMRGLWGVI